VDSLREKDIWRDRMNRAVVKNAVGALDKLLSEARRALWQIEADVFQYGFEGGRYENS
jgi:hypothetical protein